MHEQVRIAPDRRREMGVFRQRESEVADVERLVKRLRQRADDRVLENARVWPSRDSGQHLLKPRGLQVAADLEVHAAHRKEPLELLDSFLVRLSVDAEERGQLALLEKARGLDVGRDHAFLDQAVRVVARIRADVGDLTRGIDEDLDLGRLEVEGAAAHSLLAERLVDLVQAVQDRCDCAVSAARYRFPAVEMCGHARVREPRRGAHHGRGRSGFARRRPRA